MVKHTRAASLSPTQPSMEKLIMYNSTSQNLICLPYPSTVSIGHSFQTRDHKFDSHHAQFRLDRNKDSLVHIELRNRSSPRADLVRLACQDHDPMKKDEKQGKQLRFFLGFEKLGKKLKEDLSPKQKGDWKDLMLMSLSFAVYVYISQRIVCAYCAWTSMANHSW